MKIIDPIISCQEALKVESGILKQSAYAEYAAMARAGIGTAETFLREFKNHLPARPKILGLIGKGHNGGDALWVIRRLLVEYPDAKITLCLPEKTSLKPNTFKALGDLSKTARDNPFDTVSDYSLNDISSKRFDIVVEGLAGMSFVPPARPSLAMQIEAANKISARFKISIDLPAGASDKPPQNPIFKADVTYPAGIAKDVVFKSFNREYCGRIRYVDIGFFDDNGGEEFVREYFASLRDFIVRPDALDFLNELRPAVSDKRSYGHLFVIAGSRSFPGAALLNVRAALRAGVGLVSAFVPESVAAQFAAVEPSAIWVQCPEDEHGSIALESFGLIREKIKAATAVMAGSGLTQNPETRALVADVLKLRPEIPALLDADAICKELAEVLAARAGSALLTPHEGEILRVAPDASDAELLAACKKYGCAIALKSSATRISEGGRIARSTRGSPVLSRAGSGDIFAGICGALLANPKVKEFFSNAEYMPDGKNSAAFGCAACGSQWLGLAAECAYAKLGETSVATSDIITFLPDALRAGVI